MPNVDEPARPCLFSCPDWPDGLIGIDDHNRIIELSPKALDILGIDPNDAIGRCVHDVLCARSRELYHDDTKCPLTKVDISPLDTSSGYWVCAAGDYIGIDYRIIDLQWNGQPMRALAFHQNQEKQFNQAELQKFSQYVENSPTAMAEFDGAGQMVFANPQMQNTLFEQGFDEFGGANIYPSQLIEICEKVCGERLTVQDVEVELGDRWFCWHFFPILSNDSATALGYLFDNTEKKLNEFRIEREKAEARRDFFAKMVHELRTPLNAIVGFSQILIRRCQATMDERDFKHLKSILASGIQLNEMVSDTLDISKIEAGKMELDIETFTVSSLLQAICDQLQTLADVKGLQLSFECNSQIVFCSDAKKVRQILVNLISNAIKYTQKGSVSVAVTSMPDGQLLFSVKDSGVGIPENQIDKLFGAYEQVSESRNRNIQGTGLGLALVAELINMLKGTISVSSKLNQGSCFEVTLSPFD